MRDDRWGKRMIERTENFHESHHASALVLVVPCLHYTAAARQEKTCTWKPTTQQVARTVQLQCEFLLGREGVRSDSLLRRCFSLECEVFVRRRSKGHKRMRERMAIYTQDRRETISFYCKIVEKMKRRRHSGKGRRWALENVSGNRTEGAHTVLI